MACYDICMKFLHTGDIHIGAKFEYLGKKAVQKREQLRDTFRAIIDTAMSQRVDIVLIAGDLFDSNAVLARDFDIVREQLARLGEKHIRTYLISGTHDVLETHAVLLRDDFLSQLPYVTLLAGKKATAYIPEFSLAVVGWSSTTKKSTTHPLTQMQPHPDARINIAMIHGSVQIPGKSAENDIPITIEEIDQSGFSYIALGHWHNMQQIETAHVPTYYAGASEPLDFNQMRSGYVLIGDVEKDALVHITPIKVSTTEFCTLDIDVTGKNMSELKKEIASQLSSKVCCRITLRGIVRPGAMIRTFELEEDLRQACFYLRISDQSSLALSDADLAQFPDITVIGRFIREMQTAIASESDDHKRALLEKSLQYGIALLDGKEII